jgi:hypothetical protein
MSDEISKALGLSSLPDVRPVERLPAVVPKVTDQDYEYARGNMIAVIEKGNEALSGILDVAGMSQNPRAYEVVAKMIDSVSAANEKLLDLQKKQKELAGETGSSAKTVNNNLFVGSTAELQAFLKKQNDSKG